MLIGLYLTFNINTNKYYTSCNKGDTGQTTALRSAFTLPLDV